MPFCPLLGEGSRTKIDYQKKGSLVLTSLLEDLVVVPEKEAKSTLILVAKRGLAPFDVDCKTTLLRSTTRTNF